MKDKIGIKRVYDKPTEKDGIRILVDRLWPRGLSKEKARVDLWLKEIAPSDSLRKWFDHTPSKWEEFKERYFRELDEKEDLISTLMDNQGQVITLLYGAREEQFNNAVVLTEYLEAKRKNP